MENATEALKIVFGIIMFVMALTLSISCFSQASSAIDAIITMRDREVEYTYVKPSSDFNKVVGVETVIPTMYKAYKENFSIYFYEYYNSEDDNKPLVLYNYYDPNGNQAIPVNYIDLEKELLPSATEAINHLNILLGKKRANIQYEKQFVHDDGLYEYFKDKKFKEILGEYYQEDAVAGKETDALEINKVKKRKITYILQ